MSLLSHPTTISLLQIVNISTASCLTGIGVATSVVFIPPLLQSPTTLLLQQWQRMYLLGRALVAPLSAINGLLCFYLAYATRHLPASTAIKKSTGYLIAGALSLGLAPYTLLVIKPTNDKLLKKLDETQGLAKTDEIVEIGLANETAHALVDWWGVLNLGRAAVGAVGALVGTWVTVM